eukprot:CAMPEP_0196662398 /NCGR_PEP_ID=MMETSP1086-20130531/48501_1 /TAXON_ID=77921 /ORGANISM="Cyanoptyche  gloeocystis , Strain SAG4.97" /LENGTH=243 /DNA_ID=CAMNT_0041997755 /DNA_START=124 /DNA_END=855 /DNA_ORIENTATION=-
MPALLVTVKSQLSSAQTLRNNLQRFQRKILGEDAEDIPEAGAASEPGVSQDNVSAEVLPAPDLKASMSNLQDLFSPSVISEAQTPLPQTPMASSSFLDMAVLSDPMPKTISSSFVPQMGPGMMTMASPSNVDLNSQGQAAALSQIQVQTPTQTQTQSHIPSQYQTQPPNAAEESVLTWLENAPSATRSEPMSTADPKAGKSPPNVGADFAGARKFDVDMLDASAAKIGEEDEIDSWFHDPTAM